MKKKCRVCKQPKILMDFRINNIRKDHLDTMCRACRKLERIRRLPQTRLRNIRQCKAFYLSHKEYFSKYCKNYYWDNKTKRRAEYDVWAAKLKFEVLTHYADGDLCCKCCGEKHIQMLTLDHINNDGNKDKKGGIQLYSKLRKQNFPKGFRVLCFNCNSSRHINGGICPHETGCFAPK